MSRLPIRVRLTLAFTLVMAVVLAAMSFFVYVRVGSTLLASIDQSLRGADGRRRAPRPRAGSTSTPRPAAASRR